ncbi:MAG: hypothetical protein ABEJ78_01140 [Haloferacaceae archaeon]
MTSPSPGESAGDDPSGTNAAVDWHLDVDASPLLRRLTYLVPSLLGGVALLAVGLVGWLVVDALAAGEVGRALGVVVLAVIGLFGRRYVPALLATDVGDSLSDRYSVRWLAVGSVVGAAVLLGSARLHAGAPLAVFVAAWTPLVLAARFPTTGYAAPDSDALVVDGTEIPLDAVRGHRAVALGPFAVYWLSYVRGVPDAPRTLVAPAEHLDSITDALSRSSTADDVASIDRQERLVAAAFGGGLLAVGPVLWVVLPLGDGHLIALYAGAAFGLFGGLLLRYVATA